MTKKMQHQEQPWKGAGQPGGTSLREVARKSGVSVETVRLVLRGERRPTVPTAQRLAAYFGVDVATIDRWAGIGGTDAANPYKAPDEAHRLTVRQRRAVDEIIMAMIDPRGPVVTAGDRQDGYGLAARHSMDEDRKNRS